MGGLFQIVPRRKEEVLNREQLIPLTPASPWGENSPKDSRIGRGYGVFSVSHSGVGEVAKYIAEQEGPSPQTELCRRVEVIRGTVWVEVA